MSFLNQLAFHWPIVSSIVILLYLARNYFNRGLRRFPTAHPAAAFTDWWRFFDVLTRRAEHTHIAAHRTHGDIVRLGPNILSFADPRAIKDIYGLNKGMTKSDFYPVQSAIANGKALQSLFSTQDEDYHARYRRCVNSAFTMSNLVKYEPLVEQTLDVFIQETMNRFVQPERPCDFARWLQFFAFDVIGDLTWSSRLGFLERNEDVDGIIRFVGDFLTYCAPVGQMPWLDKLWEKNPLRLKLQEWGWSRTIFPVTVFALKRMDERARITGKIAGVGHVGEQDGKGTDLLSMFIRAQHSHAEFMTDKQVLSSCTSMIFAGSETTAISLSSVFYFLLRNPQVYRKLETELDDAATNGGIMARSYNKVSWTEAVRLPFLDAVIQESFRLHPAPGLLLERVVPPQGATIGDEYIQAGTIVGCNPWVVHRRRAIFGEDVDDFRPERWLEASPEQLREMRSSMFVFGAGSRTCIGKNISLLEIYKLVPTFLRNFQIEMADPESDWVTHNAWFVRQLGFYTRIRTRTTPACAQH